MTSTTAKCGQRNRVAPMNDKRRLLTFAVVDELRLIVGTQKVTNRVLATSTICRLAFEQDATELLVFLSKMDRREF